MNKETMQDELQQLALQSQLDGMKLLVSNLDKAIEQGLPESMYVEYLKDIVGMFEDEIKG